MALVAHGHIFGTITRLHDQGEAVDPVTVAAELDRAGLLDTVGGPGELTAIQAETPAWYNPRRRHSYCKMLSPIDYETAHTPAAAA
jgi:replicative DNA helicase